MAGNYKDCRPFLISGENDTIDLMIPYFSYSQIQIGPLTLYPWGLFLGLAFLIGSWLVFRESAKKGIEPKKVFWLIISVFLGGMIGSRLAFLLQFPQYYLVHPSEVFRVWAGGLMFYGGFFGALIAGWLYWNKQNKGTPFLLRPFQKGRSKKGVPLAISFLQIADAVTPALALGIFITRIGCSLINDHQGAITSLPWAIQWSDGTLRHPVAEYLALNGLLMFLVFWFLRNRLKKPGQLFIVFLFWYSVSRFLLDFTRAIDMPLADPHYFGLFVSQWLGLFVIIGLTAFLIKKKTIIRRFLLI